MPKLGPDGRADTPMWMRELCVWGLIDGDPNRAVGPARRFVEAMGLPTGLHWYNWHQIPFDNDYPHYFPARDGLRQGRRRDPERTARRRTSCRTSTAGCGTRATATATTWQFLGSPAPPPPRTPTANPYIETYGSKEADGSPVRLAVMCPATTLWQRTVADIVLKLMNDCGVRAVYIDQVAAAKPRLCFDPDHGHPTGGGSWWTDAYGKMLRAIRNACPPATC